MSNYITQQAAQARVAEQIRSAEQWALVREVRGARRATRPAEESTGRRARRFHLPLGHAVHA